MRSAAAGHALTAALFAYAASAAAPWSNVEYWVHSPPGRSTCGNVIADPYVLLAEKVAPAALACACGLIVWCFKAHRWPLLPVAALVVFAITSACLALEHRYLADFGLEVTPRWWPHGSILR